MVRYLCIVMVSGSLACVIQEPPHHPSIAEQTPDHPPATERLPDPAPAPESVASVEPVAQPVQPATLRQPYVRPHMPSRHGEWNPSRGEHPPDRVVPPPARRCRTVVASQVEGRPYTVRQSDGSYAVGVEPVSVGAVPLEMCDLPSRTP